MSDEETNRYQPFSDRELRTFQDGLVAGLTSPSSPISDNYAHGLMAEITAEANSRGEDRARMILRIVE